MQKCDWFSRIRSKMHSHLSALTDAEIENGIQELDATYPGDYIPLRDEIIFVVGSKS